MKKLEAIVPPNKVEAVKEALAKRGFVGMTVTEVRGFGRQHGQGEMYRGAEYTIDFVPKSLITIVTRDDAMMLANVIINTVRTGKVGDGKIFISELQEVIRIRTSETGRDAL